MTILAIDPGNEQSAFVIYDPDTGAIHGKGIHANGSLRKEILTHFVKSSTSEPRHLAIEMVACYGMAVGVTIFDTAFWVGRFVEAWESTGEDHTIIYRKDVKMHLCNSMRAKDSNIRQALIDRFGPGKDKAIGKKATPGPLYGFKKDLWAALAVAVTFADAKLEGEK